MWEKSTSPGQGQGCKCKDPHPWATAWSPEIPPKQAGCTGAGQEGAASSTQMCRVQPQHTQPSCSCVQSQDNASFFLWHHQLRLCPALAGPGQGGVLLCQLNGACTFPTATWHQRDAHGAAWAVSPWGLKSAFPRWSLLCPGGIPQEGFSCSCTGM